MYKLIFSIALAVYSLTAFASSKHDDDLKKILSEIETIKDRPARKAKLNLFLTTLEKETDQFADQDQLSQEQIRVYDLISLITPAARFECKKATSSLLLLCAEQDATAREIEDQQMLNKLLVLICAEDGKEAQFKNLCGQN